jgi:NAD(P)-dependent dehydrogenase (short-subunit alcohol dehydrogenase family)
MMKTKKEQAQERTQEAAKRSPQEQLARLDEIASAVVFLASAEADYITGIGLNVAGGSMLR